MQRAQIVALAAIHTPKISYNYSFSSFPSRLILRASTQFSLHHPSSIGGYQKSSHEESVHIGYSLRNSGECFAQFTSRCVRVDTWRHHDFSLTPHSSIIVSAPGIAATHCASFGVVPSSASANLPLGGYQACCGPCERRAMMGSRNSSG